MFFIGITHLCVDYYITDLFTSENFTIINGSFGCVVVAFIFSFLKLRRFHVAGSSKPRLNAIELL